uniref:Transmembrane protein n=1 Tax=Setaria italica TaxID=4555 RepID=K3Y3Y3_SETIT
MMTTTNLGLPLIGFPGVHTVRVLSTRKRNLRPYPVSLLDRPPALELFVSGEVGGTGRWCRELMKQRVYVYMEYVKVTCVLLGVVFVSSIRESWRFRVEQYDAGSANEKDEARRKTEELKNRRITAIDEWKKERSNREGQVILVLFVK